MHFKGKVQMSGTGSAKAFGSRAGGAQGPWVNVWSRSAVGLAFFLVACSGNGKLGSTANGLLEAPDSGAAAVSAGGEQNATGATPTDSPVAPSDSPGDGTPEPSPAPGGTGTEQDGNPSGHSKGDPSDEIRVSALIGKLEKVTKASESDVTKFFRSNCAACHGPGAPNASFWSIDFEGLNRNLIVTDPQAATVFQTLVNAVERRSKPRPMPLGVNFEGQPEQEQGHLRVIKWYIEESPDVAIAAWQDFKQFNPFGEAKINFSFRCVAPVSFRAYLSRLFMDAFERLPTQEEFAAIAEREGATLDAAVTPQLRKAVSKRLLSDARWRSEFLEKGLRRFATSLSGADNIRKSPNASEKPAGTGGIPDALKGGLTAEEASDLKQEFYQLLLGNIDPKTGAEKKKYQELLLGNEIFVSDVTRNLYGCGGKPQPGEWVPCDMKQASSNEFRQSYFTSHSYLASLPSSVLMDNNNYGRTSALYHFIKGDPLKAATNGPTGGAVAPLPQCLKSKDTRGHQAGTSFSPIGTIQIPLTGNVCQSCHIDRNLANGSLLFRPFGVWGQSLNAADLSKHGEAIPGVSEALKMQRRSVADPTDATKVTDVDIEFLRGLMPSSNGKFDGEQACVVVDGQEKILSNVKDLAEFLIGDGRALGSGMARHIPKGISNLSTTNAELIAVMERTFMESEGRLLPLFEAYFASETYSCRNLE